VKYLLLSIFVFLLIATAADRLSRRLGEGDRPVLYWVTDLSGAREEQLAAFHDWLEKKGYPQFEVRIDSTNHDASKKLIQGVSGVGADIIHCARDEAWLLHATGMMEDLKPYAEQHGFTPDQTWPAVQAALQIDGEQVGFPRAISNQVYFLNLGLFEQAGLPEPPQTWTLEAFEEVGKAFVAAANPPGERQEIFFVDTVNMVSLRRSMGRSILNETMTRCTLNTPEGIRALRLIHKWMYEDKIIPTQADLDFFTGSDTVTSRNQLFVRGRYALVTGARYTLVQLREHPELKLAVRGAPYDHFPNILLGSGSVGLYKGSPHKELGAYLLEFFTSEEYNMAIVRTADAMPPVPRYTETEAYLRPPDYPNEWNLHKPMADLMSIGISISASPFILPGTVSRIESRYRQGMLAGVYTPEEAAELAELFINRQIDTNVAADPALKKRYESLLRDQETIDRLRARGEPVPLELITNPFYRRYYVERGWAVEEGSP
jgi:multiple sugar transport system substrate-binding protein